jgi:hypothetical protein
MQGIPITQTFALMFFIPQVLGEILTISAWALFYKAGLPAMDSLETPSRRTDSWLRFLTWTCHYAQVGTFCTILLEFTTLLCQGWNGFLLNSVDWSLAISFSCCLYPLLLVVPHSLFPRPQLRIPALSPIYYAFCSGICIGVSIFTPVQIYIHKKFWSNNNFSNGEFIALALSTAICIIAITAICFTGPGILISFLLKIVGERLSNTALGQIFGIPSSKQERDLIIIFLLNLAIAVLGYCYLFRSKDTVNPSWTGVFG